MPDEPQYETLGEFYAATAAEIRRRGWTRGWFTNHGRVCILGGMNCALGDKPDGTAWPLHASQVLAQFLGTGSIPFYNDYTATSRVEVLKTLDLAAWVFDDTPFDPRG